MMIILQLVKFYKYIYQIHKTSILLLQGFVKKKKLQNEV